MRRCPSCESTHPDGTVYCPDCGGPLEASGDDLELAATGLDFGVAATAIGPALVRDTSEEVGGGPPPGDEAPRPRPRPPAPKTEESDALVGKTVGGVYKVLERIGVGGMGVVYKVEHVNLGKQFALKMLGKIASDHPDALERFRQEAVSASRIEHANIVDIMTLDATEEGHLYIVMELLRGQSLAEALREGAMPPGRALPIAYQICSALHAAHEAGIIHRDLKPENVFLTRKADVEFVKILDFGISKMHDAETERVRITKTGHVLGTPLYMSPEQAKGISQLDRRVDVYSLGVILYEMVAGQPPFTGDNYFQLIWKHSNEAPAELPGNAPPRLKAVVMKALEKEPQNRWGSMVELEEALAEAVPNVPRPSFLLDSRASSTSSLALPVGSEPAVPRTRAATYVAAAVLVLGGSVGAWLAFRGDGDGDARAGLVPVIEIRDSGAADGGGVDRDADESEAAGPAMVRVQVRTDPAGAEVFLGAERLGETPIDLERQASTAELELRIVMQGYVTVTRAVTLTEGVTVETPLKRSRPGGPVKEGPVPFKTDF